MLYVQTTATRKLQALNKRIRGVAGGTSASKTVSILLILIDYAQKHDDEIISVVSESFPHLKRGAIRDFVSIMQGHNYWVDSRWNETDKIYTYETGSRLEFFSADQPGKVRGPRRNVLFVNEANNISYETYTQLEIRTKDIVWLDWNPVTSFWFYESDIPGEVAVKDRPDCDFIILTYKDNEALSLQEAATLEMRKGNKNWWRVYGEGQLGELVGRIYTGWQIIDEIPHEARLERRGLDFGYSNDFTAIVAVYYYNGGYILDEELYQKGMSNKPIADVITNLTDKQTLVVADSAEPKSIDEIKAYGINILPVVKGADSVQQGIQFVQDQKISITKRSVNLLKEYRGYMWLTDKDGKSINKPQDFMNDALDATRYGFDAMRTVVTEDKTTRLAKEAAKTIMDQIRGI
jgi:phage terminase large subunit